MSARASTQRTSAEVRYAVLWLLEAGPQTAYRLSRRLGWTHGATMQVVRRLTLIGVIDRTKRYDWQSGRMVYWYQLKAPIIWD